MGSTPTAVVAPPNDVLRSHKRACIVERWQRRLPRIVQGYAVIATLAWVALLAHALGAL